MGTFRSNLGKKSQRCGLGATIVLVAKIFAIHSLLVHNVHIVNAKSAVISPSSNYNEAFEETTEPVPESTLDPEPAHVPPIILNVMKDPEAEMEMSSNATILTFVLGKKESKEDWRIAVHLKDCDFDTNDSIKLIGHDGKVQVWYCSKKTITNGFYAVPKNYRGRKSYDREKAHEAIDSLRNVTIVPNLDHNSGIRGEKVKAVVVISIYKDFPGSNNCPENLFNCHQTICTCCGEPPHEARTSRCIPEALKCDSNPNCGVKENNIDEKDEICHPAKACQCPTVCLAWNYVLTSLAIAILFIITPTAIVFALFHRRNVALERARLIRLAQMRMAEMRGGFTRDDPLNDHPPTYDEVYDIKEPPPCFCQAVAMQREYELQHINAEETERSSNEPIQFQNLGFECSCGDIKKVAAEQDIPPSYADVSTTTNDNVQERNEEDNVIQEDSGRIQTEGTSPSVTSD